MQESINRLDERESLWDFWTRYIFAGREDIDAISFVVSPICMLTLMLRYCHVWNWVIAPDSAKTEEKKDVKSEKEKDDKPSTVKEKETENRSSCFCKRLFRSIDLKSEEMVTKERIMKELEQMIVEDFTFEGKKNGKGK